MPRTRRHGPYIPAGDLASEDEIDSAPGSDIAVADPALSPRPPVDGHALDVVALLGEILGRDAQRGVAVPELKCYACQRRSSAVLARSLSLPRVLLAGTRVKK